MKKHLILFFAGVILSYGNIKAQTVPDKKEILKVTLHVNDYFMKKYADYRTPSFVKKVVRPSNIWTRSVYYEGLMALYSIYPADEYYLYAKEWADYHQWGFHRGTTTRNADNYCASQIYLDLYNICPDPEKIRKTKANMDMLVNTPQINDWWWIDAIQMGMPIFAKWGNLQANRSTSTKCGICTNIPVINTERTECSMSKKVCGGETIISILHTKSLMAKTVIGAVVTDGYTQLWCG